MPRPRYPGLTPREQEVYELLRDGLTNPQIAEALGISLDGAKYHVSQILMKLEVGSREEAASLAPERRVLGLGPMGAALQKLSLGGVMKTTTVAVLFGAIVIVALIAVGVFVTQTRSENGEEAVATPELPLTPGGEASVFLALLQHLPAAADGLLYFNDYAALREALGIQAPSQDATTGEIVTYWATLSEAGMYSHPMSGNFSNSAEDWNLELGLNLTNMDQSVSWTTIPAACGGRSVVRGRFNEAEIDTALRQTSSFRDALTRDVYNGVPYFAWHEDCGVPGAGQRPGFAEGPWPNSPARFVAGSQVVYWTSDSTAVIEGMIDATLGAVPSLAILPQYQLLAQAFAETGVFSAYVEVHSDVLWFEPARLLAEGEYGRNGPNVVEAQGYLRPYTGLAIGVGRDKDETYAVLVFLHATEHDAATNVAILQTRVDSGTRYRGRPWSDTITRSEITAKGAVLQAKFWATDPRFLLQAWLDLDSLFMSRP